jgi:hypothetical protein
MISFICSIHENRCFKFRLEELAQSMLAQFGFRNMRFIPILAVIATSIPLVLCTLGSYSGHYGVGVIDIEVPFPSPFNVTDITLLNNSTSVFTVCLITSILYSRF